MSKFQIIEAYGSSNIKIIQLLFNGIIEAASVVIAYRQFPNKVKCAIQAGEREIGRRL